MSVELKLDERILLCAFKFAMSTGDWENRRMILDAIKQNRSQLSRHVKDVICYKIGVLGYDKFHRSAADAKDWDQLRVELLGDK